MAEERDDTEHTRRPDAETARRSHQARRRRQKHRSQHLVHDRRRHADADGVRGADGASLQATFRGAARPFLSNSRRRAGARRSGQGAGDGRAGRARHSALLLMLAALRRQRHPAPHRVLVRAAHAGTVENFAGGGPRPAVLQAGARQFRQGPDQARAVRRGDRRRCCGRNATVSAASSPPIRR